MLTQIGCMRTTKKARLNPKSERAPLVTKPPHPLNSQTHPYTLLCIPNSMTDTQSSEKVISVCCHKRATRICARMMHEIPIPPRCIDSLCFICDKC